MYTIWLNEREQSETRESTAFDKEKRPQTPNPIHSKINNPQR